MSIETATIPAAKQTVPSTTTTTTTTATTGSSSNGLINLLNNTSTTNQTNFISITSSNTPLKDATRHHPYLNSGSHSNGNGPINTSSIPHEDIKAVSFIIFFLLLLLLCFCIK